jgi:putative membrane protein
MPTLEPLDDAQRAAIRQAVVDAEAGSGAELVPVLAARSDEYRVAEWRAALLGAAAGVAVAAFAPELAGWSRWASGVPALLAVGGALAGFAAARIPSVRRAFSGAGELDARVEAAARDAFVEHEVFRTRDRTGLLLYVSLFERRVRILADEGVYRAVPEAVWRQVASETAARMRDGEPGEALLAAVRRAGELVGEHGPRRRPDDRNELPDPPAARPSGG